MVWTTKADISLQCVIIFERDSENVGYIESRGSKAFICVCLCVSSVCPQHNSKMNDPKDFKHGVGQGWATSSSSGPYIPKVMYSTGQINYQISVKCSMFTINTSGWPHSAPRIMTYWGKPNAMDYRICMPTIGGPVKVPLRARSGLRAVCCPPLV